MGALAAKDWGLVVAIVILAVVSKIATGVFAASQLRRVMACKSSRLELLWLAEVSWASCRSAPPSRWAWSLWACTEQLFGDFCLHPSQVPSCSDLLCSLPKPRKPRRLAPSLRV